MKSGKYNTQYRKGAAMMPEIMALNRDRMPAGRAAGTMPPAAPVMSRRSQPANALRFAKGGKVKHSDEAMDKKLIKKMIEQTKHKMPKKAHGGKVKGYAAGGVAKMRKGVADKSGAPKRQPRGKLVPGH
ncbi:MAG TPA: hypothetical protein PLF84_21585 [Bryobacteraceae bacterium]|nr:hypothetical protein [Bryobacteraceae bacterium]